MAFGRQPCDRLLNPLSVCLRPGLSGFLPCPNALPDSFVTLSCQSHANLLNNLDNDDQNGYRHQHDVRLITVVTVVDGNAAQSAAANRACHSGIAQNGGGGDSRSDQEGRL